MFSSRYLLFIGVCITGNTHNTLSLSIMAKSSFRLGYITDVEGNLDYFLRYVERSNVLRIESCTPQELILDLQDEESVILSLEETQSTKGLVTFDCVELSWLCNSAIRATET